MADFLPIGRKELIEELKLDEKLMANKSAKEGIESMELLLHYVELYGCSEKVWIQGQLN